MIQTTGASVKAPVSRYNAKRSAARVPQPWAALLSPVEITAPLDAAAQVRLIGLVAERQDRQAFALLFKHFAPRLKAFHLRAGLADGAAEELAQETMLLLWRKAAGFDPARAGAATWVFTITRNLRIDAARRRQGPLPGQLPDLPEADPSPSAEALILENERAIRMREALGALTAAQRHVIELSFFADTPHSSIAMALKLPLGTVKSRIRQALARLREQLGGEA